MTVHEVQTSITQTQYTWNETIRERAKLVPACMPQACIAFKSLLTITEKFRKSFLPVPHCLIHYNLIFVSRNSREHFGEYVSSYPERFQRYGVLRNVQLFKPPCIIVIMSVYRLYIFNAPYLWNRSR